MSWLNFWKYWNVQQFCSKTIKKFCFQNYLKKQNQHVTLKSKSFRKYLYFISLDVYFISHETSIRLCRKLISSSRPQVLLRSLSFEKKLLTHEQNLSGFMKKSAHTLKKCTGKLSHCKFVQTRTHRTIQNLTFLDFEKMAHTQ